MTKEMIVEALSMLDHDDDSVWTADGLPKVDVVRGLLGNDALTRAEITDAAPDFVRHSKPDKEEFDGQEEASQAQEVSTAYDDALAARDSAEKELSKLNAQLSLLREEISTKQQDIGRLNTLIDRLSPSEPNQKAIGDYLESQKRIRLERHERQLSLMRGVDPRMLQPKSPLDQAMTRKSQRGTSRPEIPFRNAAKE